MFLLVISCDAGLDGDEKAVGSVVSECLIGDSNILQRDRSCD